MNEANNKDPQATMENETEQACCLVLCGSGALALAHIGVLKAFEERAMKVVGITGSSIGAIIATFAANGHNSETILSLFLNEHPEFVREAWLGACDCAGSTKMFCPVVDLVPGARALVTRFKLAPKAGLRLLTYDLLARKTAEFNGVGYDLAPVMVGSCAIPGVIRPVRNKGKVLVDCGLYSCQCPTETGDAGTIICRVEPEASAPAVPTRVDAWFASRRQLIGGCSPVEVVGDAAHIEVSVKLSSTCACQFNDATVHELVAAGYAGAIDYLDSLKPLLTVASVQAHA